MMDHKKGRRDSLVSFSKKRNTVMVENPNSSGDNSFEWVVIGSIERLGNYILSCYRNPKPVSHIWEVETTHHDWWHHQNRDPFMMGSRESRSAFCETPTIEIQEVSHFYFFTSTASWCIQHILHTESRLLWTAWAVEEWDEWMMDHTVLGSRNFVHFLFPTNILTKRPSNWWEAEPSNTHVSYRTEGHLLKTHVVSPGWRTGRRKTVCWKAAHIDFFWLVDIHRVRRSVGWDDMQSTNPRTLLTSQQPFACLCLLLRWSMMSITIYKFENVEIYGDRGEVSTSGVLRTRSLFSLHSSS
jgi:hypothetical protein